MGKKVAIVGITGVVGEEMLNCLEKRNFPVDELRVMASARSAGKKVKFEGTDLTVIEAKEDSFAGADIVLVLDVSSSMCNTRGNKTDYYIDVDFVSNHMNTSNGGNEPFNYTNIHNNENNLYYLEPGAENNAANRKQIGTETSGSGNNTKYYLYYLDGGTKYYLNTNGTVAGTTRPAGVSGASTRIYNGALVHYRRQQRIDALRTAVNAFIDVIDHNRAIFQ